jgi:hypothetical protein
MISGLLLASARNRAGGSISPPAEDPFCLNFIDFPTLEKAICFVNFIEVP